MTVDQLREAHRARPFVPFAIWMADGRSFSVPHPEYLSIAPSGRIAVVCTDADAVSLVDPQLIARIEAIAPSEQPS